MKFVNTEETSAFQKGVRDRVVSIWRATRQEEARVGWIERQCATLCRAAVVMLRASNIIPRKIQWLWHNRVPLGKLTLFVGDPDRGKSMVATYVSATVTTGRHWVDAESSIAPSEVLVFASEDDYDDTAVPRLMAAGADLDKVQFGEMRVQHGNERPQDRQMRLDEDTETIRTCLAENPRIRLVVIDPVSNYLA